MIRRLFAPVILALGWGVFLLYANPGLLSHDSVQQLLRARAGVLSDDHPPMMSVLWAFSDAVIAGPLGMLLLQSACFLGGAYLLLRRLGLPDRTAAASASLLLWLPPISSVMAVIWKDAQMAGYLMLGTALLLEEKRRPNLAGLALLLLASTMRHNAFALTLPLVVLLYAPVKSRARYPLALGAWLGITVAAMLVTSSLPRLSHSAPRHLWHESVALADIVGTVRYADTMTDDELRPLLEGTPLVITSDIQAATRTAFPAADIAPDMLASYGGGEYIPQHWITTEHVFHRPRTAAQRAAIAAAWRAIVPTHIAAYATYRAHVTAERIGLHGEIPSATYVWFTNVLDIGGSSAATDHNAAPSRLQRLLLQGMSAMGTSFLFRPVVYLGLALVLLVFSWRRRIELALLLSALAGEAALLVLAPTVDYRYSFWLAIVTLLIALARAAQRIFAARSY